jgi:2,4-didehydro-3-deoxy-L-rhamnonate hydrolase
MNDLKFEDGFALAVASRDNEAPFIIVVNGQRAVPLGHIVRGASDDWRTALDDLYSDWSGVLAVLLDAHASNFPQVSPEQWIDISGLHWHAPLSARANIYCSAANYRKQLIKLIIARGGDPEVDRLHMSERRPIAERMVEKRSRQGEPYFFLRPTSTLARPYSTVVMPEGEHQMDWEIELGVVIGRRARNVSREHALSYIAGYTILNDLTDRSLVYRKDFPGADWLRGKGMPESMPAGPFVVPQCFAPDISALRLRLWVGDEMMQDELARDMIIDVPRLIEYLSTRVELLPGDVIATGTPAGTGAERGTFLRRGDVVRAQIDGLGYQLNQMV